MVHIPTTDDLYLRSQQEATDLRLKVEEMQGTINRMGQRYDAQSYRNEGLVAEKDRAIQQWKDLYFHERAISDGFEEEIRRLKKKIKKLSK